MTVLILTTVMKVTIFSPSYVANKAEQTDAAQELVTSVNTDLNTAGVTQNIVTNKMMGAVFETEYRLLLNGNVASAQLSQQIQARISSLISQRAEATGVSSQISSTLLKAISAELTSQFQQKIHTKVVPVQSELYAANQYNFYAIVASGILMILMFVISIFRHHFWRSFGPGLLIAGLLTAGAAGGIMLQYSDLVSGLSTIQVQLANTVGQSTVVMAGFIGLMMLLLGFMITMGHRVFSKN